MTSGSHSGNAYCVQVPSMAEVEVAMDGNKDCPPSDSSQMNSKAGGEEAKDVNLGTTAISNNTKKSEDKGKGKMFPSPSNIEANINPVGVWGKMNQGGANVWKAAPKKVFMNLGVGGKLEYTKPGQIRREETIIMHKVWGSSLLGQYVGHQPGYMALNEMRRMWGVRSKFREEPGWMIFTFENDADRDKVLKEGPYFIYGRPLILKNIPENLPLIEKTLLQFRCGFECLGFVKHAGQERF